MGTPNPHIVLRRLSLANQADFNCCDNSFLVEAELSLRAEGARLSYSVRPVVPYRKQYGPEAGDARTYIEQPDRAAWLAYVDERLAGQILVQEHWNRFAMIWDIAVDPPFRRQGVGRRLIEQAVSWARKRGLPGLMLETQNINVGACRLYEACGFVLGGFDTHLYRGMTPGTLEVALFWYLAF
jgi:streptothricin acetyltransferase